MELNTHGVLSPLSSCFTLPHIIRKPYAGLSTSTSTPHTPIFQVGQTFVQTDF